MKFLKFLSVFLAAAFIFTACEKEYSYEDGIAKGTLKKDDATNDCLPQTVNGAYVKDTTLKAATNFVDLQVNITETGAYDIKTDTVNGYYFRGVGATENLGLTTIRLTGYGKPIAASVDEFTVAFDTSHCTFSVQVLALPLTAAGAVFSFGGAGAACTGAVVNGTYTSGVATSTTANSVTLNVTVTSPGAYNISTTSPNGVSFSASGNFTTASTTVTLFADGNTPPQSATPVTTTYTMNGTGGCSFDITYAATPAPATYTIDCGGATTAGTYQIGVPMTSANKVTIHATPTVLGSYSITTDSPNGVSFMGSGVFAGPVNTPQAIELTAVSGGTPTGTPGPVSYTATAQTGGGSTCIFAVTYTVASNGSLTATIDGASTAVNFNISPVADTSIVVTGSPLGNLYALDINGDAASGESLYLGVAKTGAFFTNGSDYNVNSFAGGVILDIIYTDATGTDFEVTSDPTTTQTPISLIHITTITASNVTGTFTATVKSTGGGTHTLSGSFNLPLE